MEGVLTCMREIAGQKRLKEDGMDEAGQWEG